MDILDILLDILLKPPQPLMGLFFNPAILYIVYRDEILYWSKTIFLFPTVKIAVVVGCIIKS